MKSFLKYVLATVVGVLIVNIIVFVFFFVFIGALTAFSEKTVAVPDNCVLTIQFDQPLQDRTSDNPLANIDFLSMDMTPGMGLKDILDCIRRAAQDERIKGIYLNLNDIQGFYGGLASIKEIRDALQEFKSSGKFIYSYSNLGYSQQGYYLATVADSIYVNPETPLILSGMSSSVTFYKDAMDKLGIQAEIVKVGKFKSAVEPFISTEMSDANRQQIQRYLGSMWGHIVQSISTSRSIPTDSINALADRLNFYSTEQLKAAGYFDHAVYEDEMLDILKMVCGVSSSQRLPHISLADYQYAPQAATTAPTVKDEIAVIYAQGQIGMEQSAKTIGPELAQTIRQARKDKNVKAIVLRVNSPGGSALTSDIIWREVDLAQKEKPVIVSMGDVAASGGYYISCAADTIVAEPTTLTGSIGIFGMFFSGQKLIEDKLGIHSEVVKTNAHSDFGGSFPLPLPVSSRPLSAYERNVLQNYVNQGYETFLSRVMAGRGLEHDELDAIAQGRVWTGADALEIGLVDVLGGLEDAISIAAAQAGIEHYRLAEYPAIKSPIEELYDLLTTGVKAHVLEKELGNYYGLWQDIQEMTAMQGILARLPFQLNLNE